MRILLGNPKSLTACLFSRHSAGHASPSRTGSTGTDLKDGVAQSIHKGQLVGEAQVVALALEGAVRLLRNDEHQVTGPLPRTLLASCTHRLT